MIKRGILILLFIFILVFSVNAMNVELGDTSAVYIDEVPSSLSCTATIGPDENLTRLSLYYENNQSTNWAEQAFDTNMQSGGIKVFSVSGLENATYNWNCLALSNDSIPTWAASNNTFAITFTTAASPTNQAPVLSSNIPDMVWPEDTVNDTLNLSNYFSDSDDDSLTFSVATSPSNIAVSISTDIVTFTPNANWTGSTSVKFSASDGSLSTDSNTVNIEVTAVNDPPLLVKEIPNLTWSENTDKKIDLDDYFSDIDDTSLNVTFTSVSNIDVSIDPSDNDATFTPDADWTGTRTFQFTARDSQNVTVTSNEFTLKVEEGAEEPEEAMILTKSPSETYVDMEVGESKTFSITKQPSNATVKWYVDSVLQSNATGDSFLYKAESEGNYSIAVKVESGGTSDDHQWEISVSAAGSATTPTPKTTEPKETGLEETKTVCGDGTCEEDEDQFNCCPDCGCPDDYTCNEQTKKCTRERKAGNIILVVVIVALFAGGAIGGYFYYRKKQEKEIFGLANAPIEVPPMKGEKPKVEVKKAAKPAEKKPAAAVVKKPVVKKAKTTNQILLKNYILTNLKKGKSPEEIKKTLLKVGWTEEQIKEAYTAAELDKAFS